MLFKYIAMCQTEGCIVRPVFNLLGLTKGLFCGSCKTDGMIDVTRKRCIQEGCIVRPA